MRAFVTGSTGFIGRHIVADLLARGYEVTALVRTLDQARTLPPGVQFAAGDVTKRASLRPGMRGADVVFHLAAWRAVGVRPKDRERMQRINVGGTRETLELAAELGVPRIVHASTLAVYGDTQGQMVDEAHAPNGAHFASEYARTKYLAHYEVAVPMQRRGLPLVIVCPGVVYGPGDASLLGRLQRLYARRRLPVMAGAGRAATWVHVADAAAGFRLAAEKGRTGETYILAGPSLTYREFFAACERATGIPAPRLWVPPRLIDLLTYVLRHVSPRRAEVARSFAGVTRLARADKAERELGWRARPVAEGVRDTLEAL